jgi:FixJ family two-component response regulator
VHVVDDDASFRTAIERLLKQAGYEVVTYPSAQHLLDRMPNESEMGCILLDVRIPGLSGPELQCRLSELGSTRPIVFLTGYPDVRTTVRAIKAGAEDFLTKPVSGLAGHGSRSYRETDAARAASLRAYHSRPDQQAGRERVGLDRTDSQSPPPTGDGENASSIPGRTCLPRRAGRRFGRYVR